MVISEPAPREAFMISVCRDFCSIATRCCWVLTIWMVRPAMSTRMEYAGVSESAAGTEGAAEGSGVGCRALKLLQLHKSCGWEPHGGSIGQAQGSVFGYRPALLLSCAAQHRQGFQRICWKQEGAAQDSKLAAGSSAQTAVSTKMSRQAQLRAGWY